METGFPQGLVDNRIATNQSSKMRGKFITFEGGEGSGKSTQVAGLAMRLQKLGISVQVSREPGGSAGAEAIRHVLLSGAAKPLGPHAEAILFAAARADHLRETIRPALERGQWVISDRFADSTRVYQGVLGNVEAGVIARLEKLVVGEQMPDLTIILDLDPTIGLARVTKRRGNAPIDRFEAEEFDFHKKLREAYLDLAAREPGRVAVIDASGDATSVANAVWAVVDARLQPAKQPEPIRDAS
jgi:dTMP kinase